MPKKEAPPATLLEGEGEAGPTGVRRRPVAAADGGPLPLPPRYEDLGPLAAGGSGEVRRVRDLRLGRPLVIKLLDWRHLDHPDDAARRRFENEAEVTASLEHPGVVPVYDRGTLSDGRPWFTMKEVRGETFAEAIRRHATGPQEEREDRRRRLIESLLRVAETVGYAHSRGVVHRDLKPSNLMRGAFGEVYVLDWGIAKTGVKDLAARRDEQSPSLASPASPPRTAANGQAFTAHGDVLGTVNYMAPEQARGHTRAVGPWSDVWALGLVLSELLTGARAFRGGHQAVWAQIARGTEPKLPEAGMWPRELRELVMSATRARASQRMPSGAEFAERLRSWLAGEARRTRARQLLGAADAHAQRLATLREAEAETRAEAGALLGPLHANDPDESRWLAGWRAEDRADAARDAVEDEEAEVLQLLRSALQHDPDNLEAHARLAALARAEVLTSEARGEARDAKRWSRVLAQHDDGTHASFLAGLGEVALDSEPSGAEVTLHRYVEEERRLVPQRLPGPPLRTPFRRELPRGSYLAVLRAAGRLTVHYPFTVERDACWDAEPPGATGPRPVFLPPQDAVSEGERFVPGGWCWIGDWEARCESYPRTRVWVDDLVVETYPVRLREYADYLQALLDAGDEEALDAAAPHRPSIPGWADLRRSEDGRIEIDPGMSLNPVVLGETPARLMTFAAAEAYAAWRGARDRKAWRLPTDVEWEKAARGVDARTFPWGRTPVPRWAVTLDYDPPGLKSVEAAPRDESPYGVRHVAGNVHEFTSTPWRLRPQLDARGRVVDFDASDSRPLCTVRSGSYVAELYSRALAQRFAVPPGERNWSVGVRLVRSLAPEPR
ncbi:MAG: SUMF1/EgtB/PvdO family nonheme iron enzyme [Myxococcota bacterium]